MFQLVRVLTLKERRRGFVMSESRLRATDPSYHHDFAIFSPSENKPVRSKPLYNAPFSVQQQLDVRVGHDGMQTSKLHKKVKSICHCLSHANHVMENRLLMSVGIRGNESCMHEGLPQTLAILLLRLSHFCFDLRGYIVIPCRAQYYFGIISVIDIYQIRYGSFPV